MHKRRKILSMLAVALLAGVAIMVLIPPREPSYEGRTLSQWMDEYRPGGLGPASRGLGKYYGATNSPAWEAIHRIGTNAIPYLVKWISYEQPTWKTVWYPRLNRLLRRLHPSWELRDRQSDRAQEAAIAFSILGPEAEGAIEDLGRVLSDSRANYSAQRAVSVLRGIGEKSVPSLLAGLTNKQRNVRLATIQAIPAISRGIGNFGGVIRPRSPSGLGTNSELVLPILVQCLKNQDEDLAVSAVWGLASLENVPELVVPALTEALQDSRQEVPRHAALAIRNFGRKARSAVPALLTLLTNANFQTRANATNALRQINPLALENAINP